MNIKTFIFRGRQNDSRKFPCVKLNLLSRARYFLHQIEFFCWTRISSNIRNLLLHAIFENFSLPSSWLREFWQWFMHHLSPRLIFFYFPLSPSFHHLHTGKDEKSARKHQKRRTFCVGPFSLSICRHLFVHKMLLFSFFSTSWHFSFVLFLLDECHFHFTMCSSHRGDEELSWNSSTI